MLLVKEDLIPRDAALKDLNECLRLAPGNEWARAQRDLAQHRQR